MSRRKKNNPKRKRALSRRQRAGRRSRAEALEIRMLLSAVTVNNAFDVVDAPDISSIAALISNPGADGISLREAIAAANSGVGADTIEFASGAADAFNGGGTIVLTNGDLDITTELSINGDVDGDGAPDVTISGNNSNRIFNVNGSNADASLNGLILTQGDDEEGGAVRVNRGTAAISNSVVEDNTGRFGAGVFTLRSTVTIDSTTIRNNTSTDEGGGLYSNRGTTSVSNSTIEGNSAVNFGGGINSGFNNTMTVDNSTIANNTVTNGFAGGIISRNSLQLINSTVTGNSAAISAGGLWAIGNETVQNTIVLGNSSVAGNAEIDGAVESLTTSIVTGAVADVFDQVDTNTGGGLLADNGGTVLTVMLKADTSNPALDIGDLPAGLTVDAIGNARELDIFGITNGGTVDAGALELVADVGGLVVDTTVDRTDLFDGVNSLREAIALANDPAAGPNGDGDADGDGSSNDTITFASGVGEAFENGGLIAISGDRLTPTSDVTINGDVDGDGDRDVTIRGSRTGTRLFHVTAGHTQFHGLTLSNGGSNFSQAVNGDNGVGGIQIETGAEVTLTSSLMQGNYAYRGVGAIRNEGTLTVVDSEFTNNMNYANGGLRIGTGGILNRAGASLTISNSTFRNNGVSTQYMSDQAIVTNEGTADLTNVTFHDNYGGFGGGFHNKGNAVATLTNTTLTGNHAVGLSIYAEPGAGIINDAGATLTLTNSISAGNSTRSMNDSIDLDNSGTLNLVGGNIIGDEFSVDGVVQQTGIAVEEIFDTVVELVGVEGGGIADNGGPVQTVALKSAIVNPALDSGTDSEAPTLDARGASRADHAQVANRDGNISDLGAFELPAGTVMFSSFSGAARGAVDVVEGTTAVTDLSVIDDIDSEGSGITYAITGGDDSALFTVDLTSGEINFITAPDFDISSDANSDGVYEVEVEATDSDGNTATQIVDVTVTDIAETFVVDNIGDTDDGDYSTGELTLREAIALANTGVDSADTITFASGVGEAFENGGLIAISGDRLTPTSDLTINGDVDGDGDRDVTIRGSRTGTRLFHVTAGHTQFHGLTLSNGGSNFSQAFNGDNGVGGIQIETGAEVTLTSSLMQGNYAYRGVGAIRNEGTLTVVDSEFTNNMNYANGGLRIGTGGILNRAGASLTISNSTFRNNGVSTQYMSDQAIVTNEGTADLTNVTFHDNYGGFGGGFHNKGTGVATLTNSTLTGNHAVGLSIYAEPGAGIINDAGATLTLTNSISAGNSTRSMNDSIDLDNSGTLNLVGGNIIGDEFSVDGVVQQTGIAVEEIFDTVVELVGVEGGGIADNGGPVQTVALKSAIVNPALDSGTDSEAPTLDARGASRADHAQVANRDGNISDLGAFELPAGTVMFSSFSGAARGAVDVVEGTTAVTDLSVIDDIDSEGSGITYAITGGDDSALFTVDLTSGEINFITAPDFDISSDANSDGVYEVQVEATDSDGNTATQIVDVTVTDIAETFVVDNIGDTDDGDYSAGELTLREAVNLTNTGSETADTITFASGIGEAFENEVTIRLVQGEIAIRGPVDIQGNGKVFITADANADDVTDSGGFTDVDATTASDAADSDGIDNDGDGMTDGDDTDGENLLDDNSRIFNIFGEESVTSLSGLTLTGGRTTGSGEWGGAIRHDSHLTLSNSVVSGNSTSGFFSKGGAVSGKYVEAGAGDYEFADLIVNSSTLDNNRTTGRFSGGGAIHNYGGMVDIDDSSISGNRTAEFGSAGGGVLAFFSPLTISNSQINNNHTVGERGAGGGVNGYRAIITNSQFIGNSTNGMDSTGGGISVTKELRLTDSLVDDNHTIGQSAKGGGIYMGYVTRGATIRNSTITNNSTDGWIAGGGGIYIRQRDTLIIDSVIDSNTTKGDSSRGGGVSHNGIGTLTIRDSSITNNTIEGYNSGGGGVEGHSLVMSGTTVTGNRVMGDKGWGGGIRSSHSTISDSHISDNHTYGRYGRGGGVSSSNLTMTSTTVASNSTNGANAGGGGAYASTHMNVSNSTFTGNSTNGYFSPGGGLYSTRIMQVTNTTVTGNSTHGQLSIGGGIYHEGVNSTVTPDGLFLNNNIVMGNVTTSSGVDGEETAVGIHSNETVLTGGNIIGSDVFENDTDIGDTTSDEVFASLVDNDGVLAGLLDDNGGSQLSVALKATATNPAINAGDNSLQNNATDARGTGFDRVRAEVVDLGSFEIANDAPVITSNGGGDSVSTTIVENSSAVTNVESTDDSDAESSGLSYSLASTDNGGMDNSLFTIDSVTGEVAFTQAPDFEVPVDADGDNVYEVQVMVVDSLGGTDTQNVSVEVINASQLNVDSVVIDNGDAQRSMVRSVTIEFDEPNITFGAAAFTVLNTKTGDAYTPTISTTSTTDQTIVTLTFSGTGVVGGSLADGNYRLTISADAVFGSGEIESDRVDDFFRLFGDVDGDRDVDRLDYLYFRRSYGRSTGDPYFSDAFDSNGDGIVDQLDFALFKRNYRSRLDA